jgi:hypothetical protein
MLRHNQPVLQSPNHRESLRKRVEDDQRCRCHQALTLCLDHRGKIGGLGHSVLVVRLVGVGTFSCTRGVSCPIEVGRERFPGLNGGGGCLATWVCWVICFKPVLMGSGTRCCLRRPLARSGTGMALVGCNCVLCGTVRRGHLATGRCVDNRVAGPSCFIFLRVTSHGSCQEWAASYAEKAAPSFGATVSARVAWMEQEAWCL